MQNFEEAKKYGQRKIDAREGKAKLEKGHGMVSLEVVFCAVITGLATHWAAGVAALLVLFFLLEKFKGLRKVWALVFSLFYTVPVLMFTWHIASQAGGDKWAVMGVGALAAIVVLGWSLSMHQWGFTAMLSEAKAAEDESQQGIP